MKKRLLLLLAAVGPGLFLIGYNIGTGSITTMAVAGAEFGLGMMLPLLLSCIFTWFLIAVFGRYTAVTGDTALNSYRRHFGTPIALVVLASLLVSEWVSCMGVMGIVTQVVQEWSKPLTSDGEGFSPIILATIFGGVIYWLFWNGKHQFFERVLAVFVAFMGICFILTMFMVIPDPAELVKGLRPYIPTETNGWLIMAGMVGTTMGGILYVVRSILVQEKGWSAEDLNKEKRDAAVAAIAMFVLSVAIMASAAGTLYPKGLTVENAIDMVTLLEPLAGRFAVSIFVTGIICAGLSSMFPIVLLAPWLIADFSGTPRNMRSTQSRLLVLFGVLLGLVIPVFGGRPVFIMIVSQAATSIATPLVLFLMLLLVNRKDIMGRYVATRAQNISLIFIVLFTLVMATAGIVGIIG